MFIAPTVADRLVVARNPLPAVEAARVGHIIANAARLKIASFDLSSFRRV